MFWDEVGDEVWKFVQNVFLTGRFDVRAAETLLVLIPKGDHPQSFRDFRPITLCNVIHEIISKVLVNRLRLYLEKIVRPLQSSFIPGRSTKDNAIIFQEIFHHLQKKKSKRGEGL